MFYYAETFNRDITGWNIYSITNMKGMFQGAEQFNQDISTWDVVAARHGGGMDFRDMFNGATNFNQDLSDWSKPPTRSETDDMYLGSAMEFFYEHH